MFWAGTKYIFNVFFPEFKLPFPFFMFSTLRGCQTQTCVLGLTTCLFVTKQSLALCFNWTTINAHQLATSHQLRMSRFQYLFKRHLYISASNGCLQKQKLSYTCHVHMLLSSGEDRGIFIECQRSSGTVIFSAMSVILFAEGSHMTITNDTLDLTIQNPPPSACTHPSVQEPTSPPPLTHTQV